MEEQAKTGNSASLLAAGSALLVLAVGWVDYATGEELSVAILYLVPYWNAVVLLGFFWVVVYFLSAGKASQEGLESKVEDRTSALRREIRERRQAEDRLTQANDELSQSRERLIEALADLQKSHAELEATQRQLIEATKLESLGRLAAGVAHEVKDPLMTLTMVADYLAQVVPASEPDAAPMLQDMRDAIQRANRVISELLEFSRPGELTLKPEDLHAIVDRALSLVKLAAARHHSDVVRQFGAALPPRPMDKNKIEQVLVNIFMNAIQAMSHLEYLRRLAFGGNWT